MNKQDVIAFFDRRAADWDATVERDDKKIAAILHFAGIEKGVSVLDVACGTGVLIPDYLARGVKKITAVDISPGMIAAAKAKCDDPRVEFIHGDIETAEFPERFDACVVYNAFPHFPDPAALIKALAGKLNANGRLTVAHGASREIINDGHSGAASQVSTGLISAEDTAALFEKYFDVDTVVSDENIYAVSGVLRKK
ncbi:MAG: class I SAM-dependent methyltransferase [Clostridiales bacterium]|jgi:demethylmenaquinone methyltransferase/2-methoxy-6-polyprenyl-1,4-benzoquinol methylase|nr:class I SAM-dependent methyltransferase [Clostridiales bacterium]